MVGHVSSLMDLDASVRLHGALVRKRGVRNAADLLHLGLLSRSSISAASNASR